MERLSSGVIAPYCWRRRGGGLALHDNSRCTTGLVQLAGLEVVFPVRSAWMLKAMMVLECPAVLGLSSVGERLPQPAHRVPPSLSTHHIGTFVTALRVYSAARRLLALFSLSPAAKQVEMSVCLMSELLIKSHLVSRLYRCTVVK